MKIKFSDVLYSEGYRELRLFKLSAAVVDSGDTAILVGYNTVPPKNPRAQLVILDSSGRVVLRRRYDVDDLTLLDVKIANDGGLIAVYVPLRHLIAYGADGARLWLYEALSDAILSWSLSDDGRLTTVAEGQFIPTPDLSSKRGTISQFRESAIFIRYNLTLLESGSAIWTKTLELSHPTSNSVSVAVSPRGRYIAVTWPTSLDVMHPKDVSTRTRLGVFSNDGDSLWSIVLDKASDSSYIYDLGVSDDGRVLLCYDYKVISAIDGRIVWVKQIADKQFGCRVSRDSSGALVGGGGKMYMIDSGGQTLWTMDYDVNRFDISNNNYAVLASESTVILLSPKGEVVRREVLDEEVRYVKISSNGRCFAALTENYIHTFRTGVSN